MANKNKKIKRLVKVANQATSASFEFIPTLTHAVSGPTATSETAENTFGVDHTDGQPSARSVTELEALVTTQSQRIADLEYRLEESRMRQRGLREEIKVREEITADINREIRDAKKQLIAAADELQSLNRKYLQMRANLDEVTSEANDLRAALDQGSQADPDKESLIAELENEAASVAGKLADLQNYVEGRKAIWHEREAEFAVLQAELEQLRIRNRELEAKQPRSSDDTDASTSAPAVYEFELERLRKDNERFEAYADELRIKLQDQMKATRDSTSMRHKLEANLEVASRMINDLTSQLENEQSANRELLETNEALKSDFAREARQIRFELGAAQQTISDQDSMNQQLASDLIDNKGFRQALEVHLSDMEKEKARAIEKLEKKLAGAEAKTDEYERKLRIKDGAIADLMQELADQSSKLNFTGQLESALQKIDGHRPDHAAPARQGDRVTRQLIGSADGKELRFPLFRKRLSIGRTRHNDIQLDLRFVSRRHAVIATDNHATRIIDWGSRNGVYVNKKRITEKILESGDVITIGLTNLRYEERTKR